MVDLLNLAFLTGKSVDKVFATGTGSFSVGGGTSTTHNVPHTHGKIPFFNVYWSLDNVIWFPTGHIDNQTFGPLSNTEVNAYTTSTNLTFHAITSGGGTRTIYYKYELFFTEL